MADKKQMAWLMLGVALGLPAWPAAHGESGLESRGKQLVINNCARCHAVGTSGESPHPQAPPFRLLSLRYPITALEESLVEGLLTGHPDMPEFTFEIDDARAVLAYLQAIQQATSTSPLRDQK